MRNETHDERLAREAREHTHDCIAQGIGVILSAAAYVALLTWAL